MRLPLLSSTPRQSLAGRRRCSFDPRTRARVDAQRRDLVLTVGGPRADSAVATAPQDCPGHTHRWDSDRRPPEVIRASEARSAGPRASPATPRQEHRFWLNHRVHVTRMDHFGKACGQYCGEHKLLNPRRIHLQLNCALQGYAANRRWLALLSKPSTSSNWIWICLKSSSSSMNTSTKTGSKCDPDPSLMMATATSCSMAFL